MLRAFRDIAIGMPIGLILVALLTFALAPAVLIGAILVKA